MLFHTSFFIFLSAIVAYVSAGDLLSVGSTAPDFKLPDAQGKFHTLSDYRGKKVVLYFYPKDGTPGCTREACNLRDNYKMLQEKGLVILGISYDDSASHKEFKEKNRLPFTLLSDKKKKVADLYGAKGGIFSFFGAKRITYLIDENGKIIHVFNKVDTGNHAEQILKILEEQKSDRPEEMQQDTTSIE